VVFNVKLNVENAVKDGHFEFHKPGQSMPSNSNSANSGCHYNRADELPGITGCDSSAVTMPGWTAFFIRNRCPPSEVQSGSRERASGARSRAPTHETSLAVATKQGEALITTHPEGEHLLYLLRETLSDYRANSFLLII